MEKTKRIGLWASIIDSVRAFAANTETDGNGKIDERKLTSEEKKELEEIRKMDKVETLEERVNFRKKYGATVDEAEANKKLKEAVKEENEKTIETK